MIAAVALLAGGTACSFESVTGSGKIVNPLIPIGSFDRVEASSAFDVTITIGGPGSLQLHVDDNVLPKVVHEVSGGTLHLGLKRGVSVEHATLKADVTLPALTSLEGSGAARLHLQDPAAGSALPVTLSGASSVDGPVELTELTLNLSGASHAQLTGSAERLTIDGSGASKLDLLELNVGDLVLQASGATVAEVSVTKTIDASLSGASVLRYRGSPTITRSDTSGASTITKI